MYRSPLNCTVQIFSLLATLITAATICAQPSARSTTVFPDQDWLAAKPQSLSMDAELLSQASRYALSGDGAGMIVRHGRLVHSWGDTAKKFDLKSTSKSIGVTSFGLALDDGKMKLDDLACEHHTSFAVPPDSNRQTGWIESITLRQLATQTAGFEKPGGYTRLLFAPGTHWHYSDGGPNWLAECVTLAMQQDIESLMFDRILKPLGISRDDLHWRRHQYRDHQLDSHRRCEFGSGVHANVDAMARIGLLYLNRGRWENQRLLSADFIALASRADPRLDGLPEWGDGHGDASQHYGLLWWNNADRALPNVPSDAYWSWGLYDSLIVVIPSLDLVVTRAGKSWKRSPRENHYDVLAPFLDPIVASVQTRSKSPSPIDSSSAPYPPSPLIGSVTWDPVSAIGRAARGSDNWPITWMDDDTLITAYGDGWGFEPKVQKKLSLGLARIRGGPADFRGVNIRSPSGEQTGQGPQGKKASGMLMIDGVLYMLARNAENAQLAWSEDRGHSWQWSDWKFETSFGCPTFVNFGRNYQGAKDAYVYIVSPDSDSAYQAADQMVLARVDKESIGRRESYEFFVASDADGNARWSTEISDRGPVFRHPGRCYRGGMTYNPGLKRYLWCQTLRESTHPQGPRFQGGFGIYDAPQPWGPWTTVYFTQAWDVGPGESSVIPAKWISSDGRTVHLVFSGDDAFSVRRAVLAP